jgi:ketosteroid isomerase-like protein
MADLSRRTLLAATSVAVTGVAAIASQAGAEPSLELGAILDNYAAAFHAVDVEGLVRLFATRGSYLLTGQKAAVGPEALRLAYREIFERVHVDIAFDIKEAAKYAEVGWLRAASVARVKVLATGKEGPFPYNNLVVFEPEGGSWKIRSYISTPAA